MNTMLKAGRLFYGTGIIAYGVQQIVVRDFRPQILPPFPAWAHQNTVFPLVTGLAMIIFGVVIAGVVKAQGSFIGKACVYLGLYFFVLIITCHIPYLLLIFPHKLSHLGVWADLLKELAFSGGAFVIAGRFESNTAVRQKNTFYRTFLKALLPVGRLFFCTTITVFGCSHFVYTEAISQLVPTWFGWPVFWTYFGGAALFGAGCAVAFKLWIKPVAFLLAAMLFLWFILLHVPNAVAHPAAGNGNSIVSAFDALLFCGVALVLSQTKKKRKQNVPGRSGKTNVVEDWARV